MDEQIKSRVFSLVEPTYRESVHQTKRLLPKLSHTETRKRDEACLRSILFSFDEAILKAPNVLKDPAAFARLAAAHGFPLSCAIQRQRKYGNINENAMRMLAQQNCLGHKLIQLWKRISPEISRRVEKMNSNQAIPYEPFSPGIMRKMRQALTPLRDQLGFEIVCDLNLLDNPVAFLAMCQRIGYNGPGWTYDTSKPNDLNKVVGQRLIDTWRIIVTT
ncbi:hypothetical protein [Hirschia baltica]|uniref:Uncharacterized protein n=1 Tax=Hirschia baltica (strain ATCC 49814 / DSM 5838 / IFAM 1418) TaxID=582402 RepID=C6XLD9_HIRBI|nr:hypothetical protein [Hirschia baltica]ACT59738.1 hypothetical protein Hbal_2055 [Hirschia baltica ATCC 49814]